MKTKGFHTKPFAWKQTLHYERPTPTVVHDGGSIMLWAFLFLLPGDKESAAKYSGVREATAG